MIILAKIDYRYLILLLKDGFVDNTSYDSTYYWCDPEQP
jgi:hypothetical protein